MARTIALLLISLSVLLPLVTAKSTPAPCLNGRENNDCGSPCPPTCDNLNPVCSKRCAPGCFCKSGTVDNGLGECVKTEKCSECSGNTTYTACTNPCPELKPASRCFAPCFEGCVCKTNYVDLPNSDRCVLPQDLPKSDSSN